jgi:predicted MFS family arabinose efflux permease
MSLEKMTPIERRSVFSLSLVMALRMLGLFMVLPIFALYAKDLKCATPYLIGIAVGIYGLTQAIFQIPFGTLSDYMGRKKIITLGLVIFILGSMIAALSHTIWGVMLGRALQGAGAVGSTIMALVSDLTRVEQRTKAMAITGISIGASFSLAMMLGPMLAAKMQMQHIFWLGAFLSVIAIFLLFTLVPNPVLNKPASHPIKPWALLKNHPELYRLNIGIFFLHLIFTASFVVIPIALHTEAHLAGRDQWLLYLPILIGAFCLSIPCVILSEKKDYFKKLFCGGIFILALAEFLFWIFAEKLLLSALSLLLFFTAFSLLEAFLPSLVSKIAPSTHKGTALGIYSFSQFAGIFVGGVMGGWLYGTWGLTQVNLFCAVLAIFWLAIAFHMKNPHHSTII